jgi:hypothetical protein
MANENLMRELATWLASKTALVVDTELFADHMPPEMQDNAAVLLDRGGVPQGGAGSGRIGAHALQVLVRNASHHEAKRISYLIYKYLHKEAQGIDLGENFLFNAEAVTDPQFMGYDSRGRDEFSTNYTLYEASS